MSNIEDDMYEIRKLQEILIFYKNHGWIPNIDRTIDIEKSLQAINNLLSEREQDKKQLKECWNNNLELSKRIKELENRLRDINTYILINGIDEHLKTATQIKVENQQQYIIQEKINLLKKKLENNIPKQKVKNEIEALEKMFEAINKGILQEYTVEEIIIKINTLRELLEKGE